METLEQLGVDDEDRLDVLGEFCGENSSVANGLEHGLNNFGLDEISVK